MGCFASRQRAESAAEAWQQRPVRHVADRLRSTHMQLVRETFDHAPHDDYDFCGPQLGKGAFGTVLLVRKRTDGYLYAAKHIDTTGFTNTNYKLLMSEVSKRSILILLPR